MNIEHISIFDYGIGGIFFYKIEVEKDNDVEDSVLKLMTLKDHNESNCYWSTMGMNDIVNETHSTINQSQLQGAK